MARRFQRRDDACGVPLEKESSTTHSRGSYKRHTSYTSLVPVVKRLQKLGTASRAIIIGPPLRTQLGWEQDEMIAMEIVGDTLLIRARDAKTEPPTATELDHGVRNLTHMLVPRDGRKLNPTWQAILTLLKTAGPLTEHEVAERLDLTTHYTKRLLVNATERGYVTWDDHSRFAFQPAAFE